MANQEFNLLAKELNDFTVAALTRAHLAGTDLRRVLGFVVKVAHVVEQALQDVLVVLIDIKHLTPEDIKSNRLVEMKKQVDLLTVQSRYRDAEEICSRLHHLSDQYRQQIAPLVAGIYEEGEWGGLFSLLGEHEGKIIRMVHEITRDLQVRLDKASLRTLKPLNSFAAIQFNAVREGLDKLQALTRNILGASGDAGLLELTASSDEITAASIQFINHGAISMSNDKYEIGQAGAVGPGAHAQNMSFNMIWNKLEGNIDMTQLANELTELRSALSESASTPDQFVTLGQVAAAEQAASAGDGSTALKHLKSAGIWAWDVANKIGIGVATAAAKTALGI